MTAISNIAKRYRRALRNGTGIDLSLDHLLTNPQPPQTYADVVQEEG